MWLSISSRAWSIWTFWRKLVYLDILEKTGASSATISRVRRSMLENGAGGVMQDIIIREGLDQPK